MIIQSSTDKDIKELVKGIYDALSGSDKISKVGIINYCFSRELFSYDHYISKGEFVEKKTLPLNLLPEHKRKCFLEKKEIFTYHCDISTFNFPIVIEGSFNGIFMIQEKGDSTRLLSSYRALSKVVTNYYKNSLDIRLPSLKDKEFRTTTHMLNLVTEISQIIVSTNSIDDISKRFYIEMKKNFGECAIGIAVNSPQEKMLKHCFFHEFDRRMEFDDIPYEKNSKSKLLKAVIKKKEFIDENLSENTISTVIGGQPLASYFTHLVMNNKVIGAFTYQSFERTTFSPFELELCKKLIPFVTIALNSTLQNNELLKVNKKLKLDSAYDPLTKLYTRRHFYEVFETDYKNLIKEDQNVYLFLFDLNKFKGVNDNYGHTTGDQALKKIARLLKKNFSGMPLGRYGGDEFLGGLYGASDDTAASLAGDIIDQVKDLSIPYDFNGNKIGISVGILKVDVDLPLRELFPLVDKNLYQAKNNHNGIFISKSSEFLNTLNAKEKSYV